MPDRPIRICFVLDQILQHYRIPLFSALDKKGFELTICYPIWFKRFSPKLSELDDELANSVQAVPHKFERYMGFYYMGIKHLNQYDIVIFMQDLRVIDFWVATLNPNKKYKLIHWGIGVTSFDRNFWIKTAIRNFSSLFTKRLILYSEAAKKYYLNFLHNKISVAHNTVQNNQSEDFSSSKKDIFLFIGQLDRRKGLPGLMQAFAKYLQDAALTDIQKLVIIGDGEMRNELESLSEGLNISENVIFTGSINDDKLKKKYFKRAQLSVSLRQAGLSVLESFSYGVPFVTSHEAITGGERFNIRHNKTGYFVESVQDLTDLFHYAQNSQEKIAKVGAEAYKFYHNERSMEKMASVFNNVIQEVIEQ